MTPIEYLPDKLALHFFADAHAAIAKNAVRHIHVDVRMRIIQKRRIMRSIKVRLAQFVLACISMKFLVGKLAEHISRMILGQHAQQTATLIFERRRVRRDHHAVCERSIAGGQRMRTAFDLNQAHAATADGFQPLVMAQSGNVQANRATGFQDGNCILKFM